VHVELFAIEGVTELSKNDWKKIEDAAMRLMKDDRIEKTYVFLDIGMQCAITRDEEREEDEVTSAWDEALQEVRAKIAAGEPLEKYDYGLPRCPSCGELIYDLGETCIACGACLTWDTGEDEERVTLFACRKCGEPIYEIDAECWQCGEPIDNYPYTPGDDEKPYKNEHACRLLDPSKCSKFRRENGAREHDGKKYDVIYGKKKSDGKWTDQAYRYPKSTWKASEAKAHCEGKKGKFEPAAKAKDEKKEYECECIDCGHKLKTEKHCKDIKCPKCGGTMRRSDRPGPGQNTAALEIEARVDEAVARVKAFTDAVLALRKTAEDTATVLERLNKVRSEFGLDVVNSSSTSLDTEDDEDDNTEKGISMEDAAKLIKKFVEETTEDAKKAVGEAIQAELGRVIRK
jgi:predicted RNA-binding Zn-ribbon protein involved in translation (DUF1610 family)